MLAGVWGKKIGMSQLFAGNAVIPVTVIDFSNWIIVGKKTKERDGYDALQVGTLRKRFLSQDFSLEWVKKPKVYFYAIKEIKVVDSQVLEDMQLGQSLDIRPLLTAGESVDISGISKGKGFQGVVKRHGFSGGRASHGSCFGRLPGSISFMRRQGRVIKGKRLPGHMGVEKITMKNLSVVKIDDNGTCAFFKGSLPGNSGSFVFVRKKLNERVK